MGTSNKKTDRFDREFEAARSRGTKSRSNARVKSARYDARTERLIVELHTGVGIAIPARFIQGLAAAPSAARRDVQIAGGGVGLHWPRIDLDLGVRNLLAGVFGTREWMSELARHAGSRKSPAKARAARENGRKGGRPRKQAVSAPVRAS